MDMTGLTDEEREFMVTFMKRLSVVEERTRAEIAEERKQRRRERHQRKEVCRTALCPSARPMHYKY